MEDFGKKTLIYSKKIDPNRLVQQTDYQRLIEPVRLSRIVDSMKTMGFDPAFPIIVNEDDKIIDGQHRWRGAIDAGIQKVVITVCSFPSKEQEAAYFAFINDWTTRLKPDDYWYARYFGKDILAGTLYQLESDPFSLFKNKIILKLAKKKEWSKRFNITDALIIMNTVLRNTPRGWKKEVDHIFIKRIHQIGYGEVRVRCNLFLAWFNNSFGKDKNINPFAYRQSSLKAIARLYLLLKDQGFLNNGIDTITAKLRKYQFTADFLKANEVGKIDMLRNQINSGRTKMIVRSAN